MLCYLIVYLLWGKQNFVRIRVAPICFHRHSTQPDPPKTYMKLVQLLGVMDLGIHTFFKGS
jgi:hypothetical protein